MGEHSIIYHPLFKKEIKIMYTDICCVEAIDIANQVLNRTNIETPAREDFDTYLEKLRALEMNAHSESQRILGLIYSEEMSKVYEALEKIGSKVKNKNLHREYWLKCESSNNPIGSCVFDLSNYNEDYHCCFCDNPMEQK